MIQQKYREQESKWTLYRHTSPSGKVYIGITSQNPYYTCKGFVFRFEKE